MKAKQIIPAHSLTAIFTPLSNFLAAFHRKNVSSLPINQQFFKHSVRDGYVLLDSQNRVVDFNPAIQTLLAERAKIQIGCQWAAIFPELDLSRIQGNSQPQEPLILVPLENQSLSYEIMVYPVGNDRSKNSGRMLVFHNVTERDSLADALRVKINDFSRSNAFLSSLASLTLSFQAASDPTLVMNTLGNELHHLGLTCFIALFQPDTSELVVRYFSESPESIRVIEKTLGINIFGFHLDRKLFSTLYAALETRQTHFLPDEASGLAVFLGNLPGWIMDPLIKASAVSRQEASMLVPLIAAEKLMGLMGVWGKDLQEEDIAILQVYGSQVGWAIEKALLQEAEAQRLEELAHSNAMITLLSKVSSHLESSSDNELAFISLGEELAKSDLSCAIITFDPMKEVGTIRYVSFKSEILHLIEQLIGFGLVGWQIPRKFWPGDKAVKEGALDWYDNAEGIFLKLFPNLPNSVSKKIFLLMKGSQVGQLCFVPLKVHGDVIGVMPIWGLDLNPKDSMTLTVFSDQVSAILQRNIRFDKEIRKSDELTRLNAMILALSSVASQLDSTSDLNQVMSTLGQELKKMNLSCMVGTLDAAKQMMRVEYLTFGEDMKKLIGKIGIAWPEEMKIPRRLWPTDKAVTEKAPYWDPFPIGKAYRMFPYIPKEIFNNSMRKVGMDLTEPVCYLPMINEEDVIGILAVWGKGLKIEDIPALGIFANQVATAIRNTSLYMKAQSEIVERTQAEARIREALAEKEVLIKEVHHRVKNNLQVISSLLSLQAAEISDPNILDVLRESQNRVRTMALIHEKLYQSSDLARIDFSTYLQSLVNSLAQSYRVKSDQVSIQVQAEKILLDLDTAIPCGLIVNELVSNSIKYAFLDSGSGQIKISCGQASNKSYSLIISDNGIGLPAGFDPARSSSLGLRLVTSLVQQIDGELFVDGKKGARFEIKFSR